MLKIVTAIAGVMLMLTIKTFAATYYVDCELGKDTNSGTSPEKPYKTVQKLNVKPFQPGDSILFKRGQTWMGAQLNMAYSGEEGNNIVVGAYGEGTSPVLTGGVYISEWELVEDNIYKAPSPVLDEMPWLIMMNGEIIRYEKGIEPNALPSGKYLWKDGFIYLNTPNPEQVIVQKSHHIVSIKKQKYVTIENLNLTMSGCAAVLVEGASNITVRKNEISYAESGYTDGSGIHSVNTTHSLYTDNYIHNVYGDGIMLWNSSNITVSNNRIEKVFRGNWYGGDGIQSSGDTGSLKASNNKILDNYISMQNSDSPKGCIQQERGDNVIIAGNECYYGFFGIGATSNNGIIENNITAYQGLENAPNNWTAGIYIADDVPVQSMTIRNNIVHDILPIGMHITQTASSAERSEFKIFNNTVYNTGIPFKSASPLSGEIKNNIFWTDMLYKPEYLAINPPIRDPRVFTVTSVVSGESLVSNNNLIGPQLSGNYVLYANINYNSLSSYSSGTGQDAESICENPQFINPHLNNFMLYDQSPCIEMGTDVGLTEDFYGETDRRNIGAVEGTRSTRITVQSFELLQLPNAFEAKAKLATASSHAVIYLVIENEGRIIDIKSSKISCDSYTDVSAIINIDELSITDYVVKAFVWDLQRMISATEQPITLEVGNDD